MTTTNKYDLNDLIRLRSVFTIDQVDTDPTSISLFIKRPSGSVSTGTFVGADLTKEATGIYYQDVTLDDTGIWYYRFEGSGAVVSADEGQLIVERSEF